MQLPPTKPDLDVLLDTALSTGGETDRFDFKEVLDLSSGEHKIRLIRAVGAFANTDSGGFLIIGVTNDRRIVGLSPAHVDQYDQTRVANIVGSHLTPAPQVQVRHHERDGKALVVLEIDGFKEVPSIVSRFYREGREQINEGTILLRTAAAESAPLTSELEMRKLCSAIVSRRAAEVVELVHRGSRSPVFAPPVDAGGRIQRLRDQADEYWGTEEPYIEVFFEARSRWHLSADQLKQIVPGACVEVEHGFPFHDVGGIRVYEPRPWGLVGAIPLEAVHTAAPADLHYLWMFDRGGVFLDREYLWEDREMSVIKGGVSVYHLAGRLIVLVKFLQNLCRVLGLNESQQVGVGLRAVHVRGRYVADERRYPRPFADGRTACEEDVSAQADASLGDIANNSRAIVVGLLEEIFWQFGREAWTRQHAQSVVEKAKDHLGPAYAL